MRPSLLVGAETPSEAEITKEEIARKLSHAMSLIRSEAPASWDWISPVIDGFLITKGSLGRGISSSTFPGLIALTRLESELDYLDSLVSNATQQRLFQVLMVQELDDAESPGVSYLHSRRLYMSSRKLLIEAIENAHLIRLWRQILGSVPDAAALDRRIKRAIFQIRTEYEPVLNDGYGLSEAGRLLWRNAVDSI